MHAQVLRHVLGQRFGAEEGGLDHFAAINPWFVQHFAANDVD